MLFEFYFIIWMNVCLFEIWNEIPNWIRYKSTQMHACCCILNLPLDWTFQIQYKQFNKITQQFPECQCLYWLIFCLFFAPKPENIEMESNLFFARLINISNHRMWAQISVFFVFVVSPSHRHWLYRFQCQYIYGKKLSENPTYAPLWFSNLFQFSTQINSMSLLEFPHKNMEINRDERQQAGHWTNIDWEKWSEKRIPENWIILYHRWGRTKYSMTKY